MLSEVLEKHLREIQNPPVKRFSAPKLGPQAPTDKQVSYYKALVEKKQLSDDQRTHLMAALATYDKRSITRVIEWLVMLFWVPRPVVSVPIPNVIPSTAVSKINEGRYAITHPFGDMRFY